MHIVTEEQIPDNRTATVTVAVNAAVKVLMLLMHAVIEQHISQFSPVHSWSDSAATKETEEISAKATITAIAITAIFFSLDMKFLLSPGCDCFINSSSKIRTHSTMFLLKNQLLFVCCLLLPRVRVHYLILARRIPIKKIIAF